MTTISRREWVKGMALATLGTVAFYDLSAQSKQANAASWKPRAWSAEQDQLLSDWVGIIIPESAIPGAVSLGVPVFVKTMLDDCYDPAAQATFRKVLDGFKTSLESYVKKPWSQASQAEKEQFLFVMAHGNLGADAQKAMSTLKGLTIQGYTSSEEIMVNHFHYVMAPGYFNGCASVKKS
ncbi:gluconate 2-dehydrogenase subunit 3 family protein [Cytophagaceae bacterium 50C-KIRBA]|uniref:Gluconate 2-dehydrogenase subunit 3 family protein n=1 Tax=Aquirufa beregesia TaxID=2516556 RepID=A0ABX0ESI6_9BACT|nr:gluconate 2-dehydrogenase subunit 3 family protein [Aquirufa beregesia]NGZ42943.1 gluconate 2-dehydrogenase subunit 3 family protein [Aquirufa beregesia]